ncbi:MAG: hypothetical protein JO331_16095 [Verrucomicrobia bacterium]|nr:hypothetical protein [Verrucomicrobiota bacterium]
MRIVVWGINDAPERLGIAPCNVALCEYLASHACDTTMLTAFPYFGMSSSKGVLEPNNYGEMLHMNQDLSAIQAKKS